MLKMLFPRNENLLDRGARVALGAGLLSLVVVGPQTLWGLTGLILLVTGVVGSCPIYRILGLSTAGSRNG